ncbi:uncharacterized protein LOC126691531 [Quercus robur]|uniref:uncharacterized protein LOC126691531 n=1 Tax=Quercus robur TaxID=38942 RepID=UPI002162B821|nr:uncharacterized protein LOC126691531 [Quercus robur]
MSVASSSTDSLNKVIDEYCDDTSDRSSSSSASDESGGSTDENYSSGAPGLPIEVVQEQLRRASGSQAGSPSNPTDEVETVFSCAVGVHSKTDEQRLIKSLASSDRKWKTEFIFISGFWAGNPVDVGRDPFPPYTGDLGNLRPEAAKRPSLSKFHRDRVHRACLHADRSFHSLVTLRRLAKWGLGPEPSDEAIAHEVTVRKRMSTMKENRGKEIAGEGKRPEGQAQDRPTAGDKRKFLPKNIDLEGLPSRRDKRVKQSSSKVVKSKPPSSQPAVQIVDVDSSTPVESTPSKTPPRTPVARPTTPGSSQPSMNIIANEDLAWERFQMAVKDEDINMCYNMGLKEFEHSGVHDLFKAMSKFIAASRQATELDKTRVLLETRIQEVNADCKKWAGFAEKAKDEVKEHNKLIEELRTDALEKETRIDHLQQVNNELNARLSKAREDAVAEFKSSKEYTDTLDRNYAAGFEDFRMDAVENFPEVDFSTIKLNLAAATSSLLQTGSDDVNVEDDASTQPPQDEPTVNAPPS